MYVHICEEVHHLLFTPGYLLSISSKPLTKATRIGNLLFKLQVGASGKWFGVRRKGACVSVWSCRGRIFAQKISSCDVSLFLYSREYTHRYVHGGYSVYNTVLVTAGES